MGFTIKEIQAMDAEKQLIEQVRSGSSQAFSELYDKYAPALLGVILRMQPDEHQAEQVLQSVFLRIIKTITANNASGERLFTQMLKIARNFAAQSLTNSGNKAVTEIQSLDLPVNPASSALDLVYFNGLSYAEAAQQLEISIAELTTRIRLELKQKRIR